MAMQQDCGPVSAYAIDRANGYQGTVDQWLADLRGGYYNISITEPTPGVMRVEMVPSKPNMPPVAPAEITLPVGRDGANPEIGANGNWIVGGVDTGIPVYASSIEFAYVDNVDQMIDTSRKYVLRSTGEIYAYTERMVIEPPVNLYDPTSVTDKMLNTKVNAATGEVGASANGFFATDYIDISAFQSPIVLHMTGATILHSNPGEYPELTYISFYDADGVHLGYMSTVKYNATTAKNGMYCIKNDSSQDRMDFDLHLGYHTEESKVSYYDQIEKIRLTIRTNNTDTALGSAAELPDFDFIVKGSEVTSREYAWIGTGVKVSDPAGFELRIHDLENTIGDIDAALSAIIGGDA